MKKFKLKLVVQSKMSVEDSPTTYQFTSGIYSDSSEVLPDVIDFLKTVSDDNVVELDSDAVNLDLNVGELELPVFDRLYDTSNVPEVIQPELSSVTTLVEDAVEDVKVVPDDNEGDTEPDTEPDVSDSIVVASTSDEQVDVASHALNLSDFEDDILPDVGSSDIQDDVDENNLYDDDSDSIYDFENVQ